MCDKDTLKFAPLPPSILEILRPFRAILEAIRKDIRVKVILHAKDHARWLSREASDQPSADLLSPFEPEDMEDVAC